MDTVLGLLGLIVFGVCVVVFAAAVHVARREDQPERQEDLDRRQRQDVLERVVLEAVGLGDCLVRDLPVEDVDAPGQRRVAGDRLGEPVVGDLLDVREASRS